MYLFINNYSPLETILNIQGLFRLTQHPIHLSSVELKQPKWNEWVTEFIKLIYYGPLYTKLILSVPPHTQISINILSENPLAVTSGFKHKDISWGLLKEGSHELHTSGECINIDIHSLFDEYMKEVTHYGRAAKVVNININTSLKSDNEGWHTYEDPVTIVKFDTKFKEAYWTPQINSQSIY
jgi:hypothetical protein